MGGAIGKSGMDADGGVELRVVHSHDHGHRTAGRESRHVDPPGVKVMGAHDVPGHVGKDGRFALIPVLVAGLEPVPASGRVSLGCLFGVQHEKSLPFRHDIHAGARGEIVRVLRAAMEHDDQR